MLHAPDLVPSALDTRAERLAVRVSRSGARCLVAVEGELDLATAPKLRAVLVEALDEGFQELTLELSGIGHMDSTGLAVLIGLRERLKDHGKLVVAGAPPAVLRVLDMTGLSARFELAPAVEGFKGELGEPAGNDRVGLTADAELVLGLLATALPFAESRAAEAERWLRVLRSHGDTERVLREIGVSEAQRSGPGARTSADRERDRPDPTRQVIEQATILTRARGANLIGTLDLLAAVIQVYGEDFDAVLRGHGTDRAVLIRRVNSELSGTS